MTNKLTFLLVFLATGIITGCSKQVEKTTEENITGTWNWVRTDGGIGYNIHETPASTGKNIELNISSDGKYSILTNGVLTSGGTYVIESRKCIHDATDKRFINFSSDVGLMVEKVDTESLEVSDEANDGLESIYKRKSPGGN